MQGRLLPNEPGTYQKRSYVFMLQQVNMLLFLLDYFSLYSYLHIRQQVKRSLAETAEFAEILKKALMMAFLFLYYFNTAITVVFETRPLAKPGVSAFSAISSE